MPFDSSCSFDQYYFYSLNRQICGRTMPSDCLFPTGGFDTSSTELTAEVGSNSSYNSFTPVFILSTFSTSISLRINNKRHIKRLYKCNIYCMHMLYSFLQ